MTENINSEPSINFRTFAPRRDPFGDIEKPAPSPSNIPAPITKSREPQGLAAGEQAGIAIMGNDLKNSKDIIEYLKKELDNTELLSQKYFRIRDKIIQEEYKALELEKKNTRTQRKCRKKIWKEDLENIILINIILMKSDWKRAS